MARRRTQPKLRFQHVEDPEFRAFLEGEAADEEAADTAVAAGQRPAPFLDDDDLLPTTPVPASLPLQASSQPPKSPRQARAVSSKARAEDYRARRTAAGLVQVAYWVTAEDRSAVDRTMLKFTKRARGQYQRWKRDQLRDGQRSVKPITALFQQSHGVLFFPDVIADLAARYGSEFAADHAERYVTSALPAKPSTRDKYRLGVELMLALDAAFGDRSPGQTRYTADRRVCAWLVAQEISPDLSTARAFLDKMRACVRFSDLLQRWEETRSNQALDQWAEEAVLQVVDTLD